MTTLCLCTVITLNIITKSGGANSVDPDQTAPKEQSDQGLHCLPISEVMFGLLLGLKNNDRLKVLLDSFKSYLT